MINWDTVLSVIIGIGIYNLSKTLLRLISIIIFGK